MILKKAWITQHDAGMVGITLESTSPETDYKRVSATSNLFPVNPTKERPLRHTLSIGLLDADSLYLIEKAISEYLHGA